MKKLLVIATVMALVLGSFAVYGVTPATPVESSGTASVGVNEIISFTVTDLGTSGIEFGDFNPGTSDNAANPNPAVNLTVGSSTNVDVNISLKGTDWSGPAAMTLADTTVKFDDDGTLSEGSETGKSEGVLTTSYQIWYEVSAPLGGEADTTSVYHWVSIPAAQKAGDYTSTFTYRASS
jgi:hypothetical protein